MYMFFICIYYRIKIDIFIKKLESEKISDIYIVIINAKIMYFIYFLTFN